MPLPDEIQQLLPPAVVNLLNQQWDNLLLQQRIIHTAERELTELRQNLSYGDHSTPTASSLASLSAASECSAHTVIIAEAFHEVDHTQVLPTFCSLPSRGQMELAFFGWSSPPTQWIASELQHFYNIRDSLTVRKLWRFYAAANNYHSWYDINRSSGDRDLKQFPRETNVLHVHIHARNAPQSSWVFTDGWEDFFSDTLRIRWTVGTTPLNALPHATFLPVTPVCTAFGASSWTPEHLLRYTQHTHTAILYRPDCLTAKERTRWFDFFDEKMRLPPSDDRVRLYVLVNRRSCRLTNAWLDAYERSGRCHTLTSMKHMQFKHMHADGTQTWVRDPGPWDLCLIEHCKTQWHDLNTHAIARTLRQLTHKTRYPGARAHIPDAFQCYPSARKNNRCLGSFWKEWDPLAEARFLLLKKRRVDWPAVDSNLQEANRLLVNSPCPRLACVARLARIPIGGPLRKAGILIYAVVGRFAPYVGQLGGKTRRPRTPLRRRTSCVFTQLFSAVRHYQMPPG